MLRFVNLCDKPSITFSCECFSISDNFERYVKINGFRTSVTKGNSKFEILVIKTFNLKEKTNQILPETTEKK